MTFASAPHATVIFDEVVSASVKASSYQERKLRGQCTRCGMTLPEDWDNGLCPPHLEDKRKRDIKSQEERHQARRDAGQCAICGDPSETYRCEACLVRQNRVPRSGIDNGKGKAERVAARLIPWTNSPKNEGRTGRIRGGGRGRRSVQEENRSDFDLAEKDIAAFLVCVYGTIEAARKGDAFVWSTRVQALPRIQRRAAELAAMDHVAVAYRLLGEILRRGKHPSAPEIADSDEESES